MVCIDGKGRLRKKRKTVCVIKNATAQVIEAAK